MNTFFLNIYMQQQHINHIGQQKQLYKLINSLLCDLKYFLFLFIVYSALFRQNKLLICWQKIILWSVGILALCNIHVVMFISVGIILVIVWSIGILALFNIQVDIFIVSPLCLSCCSCRPRIKNLC